MMKRDKVRKINGYFWSVCLALLLVFSFSSFCRADDAMVLPKGRWMGNVGVDYYPEWDSQFNKDGDVERLAHDYNTELNGQVFPMLGSPSLSLGRSIVDFEKTATITNILFSYGVTDQITLGVKIPYWTFKTKVSSRLDPNSANMGKNPAFNPMAYDPNNPLTYPLIPTAFGGQPLTTDEVKALLGSGLDVNSDTFIDVPGFQYKPFETWSDSGLGDIEIGLKYQYLKNEKWRLAFQAGGRLATGDADDPDNLVDYGFGGGNYDIILGVQTDFLGFKDWVLNGTFRFTWQIPDKETLRVLYDVDQPLAPITQKEKVDRDLGDIVEIELGASHKLPKGFGISGTYGGFFKGPDRIKGAGGHYASMEDETEQAGHTLTLGVSYNNLEKFQNKAARVPYQFSLSHWHRFAGKNLNKAQYISLKGSLFF